MTPRPSDSFAGESGFTITRYSGGTPLATFRFVGTEPEPINKADVAIRFFCHAIVEQLPSAALEETIQHLVDVFEFYRQSAASLPETQEELPPVIGVLEPVMATPITLPEE